MPPQQADRLLDRFDERFGFGAHSTTHGKGTPRLTRRALDSQGDERCKLRAKAKPQYSPPVPDPKMRSVSAAPLKARGLASPA
jgi:hypothetical protein